MALLERKAKAVVWYSRMEYYQDSFVSLVGPNELDTPDLDYKISRSGIASDCVYLHAELPN